MTTPPGATKTGVDPSVQVSALVAAAGRRVPVLLEDVEQRLLAAAASHGEPLAGPATATIAAGGKRLRPLLVLLAAGAGTELLPPRGQELLLASATAVELVHSATLVHDDVLDASPTRRGHPTVWQTHGPAMATAVGDMLFAQAFVVLTATGRLAAVRSLSRASSALAQGELLQRADAFDVAVPLERYLHRCELKTAALFETACELGAMAAGADNDIRTGLGRFGRQIGLAFQLLDDILDVTGPQERTGKPVGTDLLDGTVTLPLILARDRDPALAARDLRTVTTPDDAAAVCEQIAATGALTDARTQALAIVAKAKAELPDVPSREVLERVGESVVERYA